jgi:hypothetical protein
MGWMVMRPLGAKGAPCSEADEAVGHHRRQFRPLVFRVQKVAMPQLEQMQAALVGPLEIVDAYRVEAALQIRIVHDDHPDAALLQPLEEGLVVEMDGEQRARPGGQHALEQPFGIGPHVHRQEDRQQVVLQEHVLEVEQDRADEVPLEVLVLMVQDADVADPLRADGQTPPAVAQVLGRGQDLLAHFRGNPPLSGHGQGGGG